MKLGVLSGFLRSDEDDDDEESEKTLMFEKRATLLIQDPVTSEWASQGLGDLQIVYDTDIFGARIIVEQDGTGDQLCNTVIALNTTLEVSCVKYKYINQF